MTKTPRHKLLRLADRYWSNPDVRLAKTNYKRERQGLEPRGSVDEIEPQSVVAARMPRDAGGRFARAGQ